MADSISTAENTLDPVIPSAERFSPKRAAANGENVLWVMGEIDKAPSPPIRN